MSKVRVVEPFEILSSKISQDSDMMIVTNSRTMKASTRRIGKRNIPKLSKLPSNIVVNPIS